MAVVAAPQDTPGLPSPVLDGTRHIGLPLLLVVFSRRVI
jgi:hypothetical protein